MNLSKLNVVVNNAQITLEGEGEWVYKVFQELKENGLGKLALENTSTKLSADQNVINFEDNLQTEEKNVVEDTAAATNNSFPSLHNIVLQGAPQTEKDWLLIYAAYCSKQGERLFTREDLRAKYTETNRKTYSRDRNFSTNLKNLISDNYISAVNEEEFRIELTGLKKAEDIIVNSSSNKKSKPKTKTKKTSAKRKAPVNYKLIDLEMSEEERNLFRAFWDKHEFDSNMDKVVLISYWLSKEKDINGCTPDYIFTMLRTIDESVTFNILSALKNGMNNKNYFAYDSDIKAYTLTYIGEDRVKNLEVS